MKSTSTTFKITKSHTLFLPPWVRKALDAKVGDEIKYIDTGVGYILLKKVENGKDRDKKD